MGQQNLKQVNKKLNTIKLKGFQLIPNKAGNNYLQLLYGGYAMTISQMSSKDVLDILADLQEAKTDAEIRAIMSGKSFATLKVVEAHGRTMVESQKHYINQDMTYADTFKSIMNIEGKPLTDCLEILKEKTESAYINSVNGWLESLKRFYPEWDVKKVHELAKKLVNNHEVMILNNHIYYRCTIYNLIKLWSSTNENKMYKPEKINDMINKLFQLDKVKAV